MHLKSAFVDLELDPWDDGNIFRINFQVPFLKNMSGAFHMSRLGSMWEILDSGAKGMHATGRSRISPMRGRQPCRGTPTSYDFTKFPPKLHEIERIWTLWGAHASLAPP